MKMKLNLKFYYSKGRVQRTVEFNFLPSNATILLVIQSNHSAFISALY